MLTFCQFVQEAVDLQELNMARVHSHVNGRDIGFITAHRAEPEHHPDWDRIKNLHPEQKANEIRRINHEANHKLEADIQKHGFGYTKVNGRYVENFGDKDKEKPTDEHSFMVFGKKKGHDGGELKDFLKKHGEKYHQDSVAHKAHGENTARLIGTSHTAWPGHGKEESLGHFHPNRISMFHSVLHGGTNQEKQSAKTIRQKDTGKELHRGLPPSKKVFTFGKKGTTTPA